MDIHKYINIMENGFVTDRFQQLCRGLYFLYPHWAFMHILGSGRDLTLFQPNNMIITS